MSLKGLYLAHPILIRDKIRAWELGFEQRTGIELSNPFYDGVERDDIKIIDAGKRSPWSAELDCDVIVRGDIGKIVERDGLLAYVERGVPSIGTFMEIWITMSLGKPVFIVSPDWGTHPWLVYCARHSGGRIFTTFEEFEKFITAEDRGCCG